MYVFLLFSLKVVYFILASLYLFYQIKISTLLDVSYGTSGTLIVGFSFFLMAMAILVPPCLYFTAMNLAINSHLLMKYAACFCFPKSNTLSSSPVIGALKIVFRVEVYCWK